MRAPRSVLALAVLSLPLACATHSELRAPPSRAHTFAIGQDDFLLDGRPIVIRAGELHAARVPPESWRQRLQMLRALGCNAVSTTLFWNQHEPRQGEFHFDGAADVARFCRTAQEEGLWVLLRAGPYVGAEWDLGGFPAWLLEQPDLQLRTRDARFLAPVERYLRRVGSELAGLQVTRGGPILMLQVEHEYGAYGKDPQYLASLVADLRAAGFDVPLSTCDGPSQLAGGTQADLLATVEFGSDPSAGFEALRKLRPHGPLMCGAYFTGWFDSWGKPHHTRALDGILQDLGTMLAQRQSFTLYMAHGGTSFGFDAGASSPPFAPQTTSHDYDAPIDEAGRATPKFHAIRSLVAQHLGPGENLPDLPAPPAIVAVPRFTLGAAAALLEQLGTRERLGEIVALEALEQAHGAVLYRATLPAGGPATLKLIELHDVAYVDLDGRRIDVLERIAGKSTLKLGARSAPARLDLFVEALGRVSYGSDLNDRKGITQRVELVDERGSTPLGPWEIFPLPFDPQQLARLTFTAVQRPLGSTAVYRGSFELGRVGDTFLDLRGWSRGLVWVNGHALGRYSKAGPQQTLYLPGAWLKKGANQVLVLDVDGGTTTLALQGLDQPILDQVGLEPTAARKLRKSGQELQLGGLAPVITETFADVQAEQRASFPATKARYVALVALGSQPEDPTTSCAEIWLVGSGGVELPRSSWSVIWADSEELEAPDGAAVHVIDGDPSTCWLTQSSGSAPPHPHSIVIDLGEEQVLTALRCLPRQESSGGRIGRCQVYLSKTPFPGL